MTTATSSSKFSMRIAAAMLVLFGGGVGRVIAQSPDTQSPDTQSSDTQSRDTENGRYALSPIAGGVIRLDTRTGAVSTCNDTGTGWACHAVPDERAALDAEIGRLQADNEKLKAQLAAREPTVTGKIDEPLPKTDSLKKVEPKAAERKIEIPLPSDRDMDRAMSFLEQAWRRLVEMANRIQKDVSGKI